MQAANSIASNPELSRGLAGLYADLRKQMQADASSLNGGQLNGSQGKSFTSADGLVTLSVSTVGLAAYAGTRTEDARTEGGDTIRAEDVDLLLDSKLRASLGGDAATSSSLDDLQSFELRMQQSMSVTEISGTETSVSSGGLFDDLSKAGLDLSDALQQRQQDAGHLIDTLTAFLQGLKGNTAWTPQTNSAVTQRETTVTQREETTSLFLRIDLKA